MTTTFAFNQQGGLPFARRDHLLDLVPSPFLNNEFVYPTYAVESTVKVRNYAYSIIVSATRENGERIKLLLVNIPIVFHVKEDYNIRFTLDLLKSLGISDSQITRIKAKDGRGYSKEESTFLEIRCTNMYLRKNAIKKLGEHRIDTFTNMTGSYVNSYLMLTQSSVSDWIFIKIATYNDGFYIVNSNDYNVVNKPLSDGGFIERPLPKLLILSYDIEVFSSTGEFPQAGNPHDEIFMIAGGIGRYDDPEPLVKYCIVNVDLRSKWREDLGHLIVCENEAELLLAFATLIKESAPEFIVAFNNYQFDDNYIYNRCLHHNIFDLFIQTATYLPLEFITYKNKEINYSMFIKTPEIKIESNRSIKVNSIAIPGVNNLDMFLLLLKDNPKNEILESHALKSYLNMFNLPSKLDMPIHIMNAAYAERDIEKLVEVCDYCIVDGLSCQRLQYVKGYVNYLFALAHVSFCQFIDCVLRATGFKVKNNIYFQGSTMKYVYNDTFRGSSNGKYEGALVLDPVKGIHKVSPVFVPDFASLYPSIMRALNISSETLLTDAKTIDQLEEEGYGLFKYDININNTIHSIAFLRYHPDGSLYRSVYCSCLEFYAKERKRYKKLMAIAEDSGEKLKAKDYNGKQLAVKVIMNTFYGLLGDANFPLYEVLIASTITSMGRECLLTAKEVASSLGFEIIYGDTDSIFIAPHVEGEDKLKKTAEIAENTIVIINNKIKELTGTDHIKMEFDKLLWPLVMLGKKCYYGTAYDVNTLKKKSEVYFSGVVTAKRGNTKYAKEVVNKVIEETLDLTSTETLREIVENAVIRLDDEIRSQPLEKFELYGKFNKGKASSVAKFVEDCIATYALLPPSISGDIRRAYTPPKPGEYFLYVVTSPHDNYTSEGKVRKDKKSGKMVLIDVFKMSNECKLDYSYYMEGIIKKLARFIHSDLDEDGVEDDEDDDFETKKKKDSAKQDKAVKYLISKVEEKVTTAHHASVRKHRKAIETAYMKGGFPRTIEIFKQMFDNPPPIVGTSYTERVINIVKSRDEKEFATKRDEDESREMQELFIKHTKVTKKKEDMIKNLYQKYTSLLQHQDLAAEFDDVDRLLEQWLQDVEQTFSKI